MGKLFGTDGIRGVANETLDAKLAYRGGQAAAISLADDSGTKPTGVIGKDTRISSDMREGALGAGLFARRQTALQAAREARERGDDLRGGRVQAALGQHQLRRAPGG